VAADRGRRFAGTSVEEGRELKLRALVLAAILLAACAGDGAENDTKPRVLPTSCGLPSPDPQARTNLVPADLLLKGAEITRTERQRKGIVAAMNVPYSVGDAFGRYRRAVLAAGYKVLGEENEGFEAEIYVGKNQKLGAVQIRTSGCSDASVVYVSLFPTTSKF
jgi:hypothetical protein